MCVHFNSYAEKQSEINISSYFSLWKQLKCTSNKKSNEISQTIQIEYKLNINWIIHILVIICYFYGNTDNSLKLKTM